MPEAFLPEKAAGVNAVIQYELTGEGGGEWVIRIADGTCEVTEGRTESPNMTLTMDAGDYVDMISGKLDPTAAFMGGKIRLAGDFSLATRLTSFFRMR
jgi:putative sterol carrier protein